uniref:ABC-type glutathione-S-conjugate transporter n=1 Tax=Onchocerca volvulus TaxID=6282 RepID=A0A8R1XNR3_ONCVO
MALIFIDTLNTHCNEILNENVSDSYDCLLINVLPIVPSIFFWLLLPIFCVQIYRIRVNGGMRSQPLPWTALLITKTVLMICLLTSALAKLIVSLFCNGSMSLIDPINWIITALTMSGLFCCISMARKNGMVTSGILHITFILLTLCEFPKCFFEWQKISSFESMQNVDKVQFIVYQLWYSSVVIQTLLFCFADYRKPFLIKRRKQLNLSPELDSSFLNRLSYWWFTKIPLLGARKTLIIDDLYELNEGTTAAYLSPKWEKQWNPAVEDYHKRQKIYESMLQDDKASNHPRKEKGPKLPSIVWRLFLMFRFEILAATAIKILSDIMQLANPFFLNLLLNYISTGDHTSVEGMIYVMAMFTCSELRSFFLNYYFHLMMRVGTKIQTTLTIAIYQKTLRLSNSARKTKTVGEIVNLMAIDVESFQFITLHIQQIWSCPFQITIVLIYLFFTIGVSAACGLAVMILFLPLNAITSIIIEKWQTEQMNLKDERMKICNEILNGIKVVKLYAWEPAMEELVEQIRRKELYLIRKMGLIRAFVDSFNISSPFLVAMLTFAAYTLSSPTHILTPQIAFVSLTLFNQLRSPMMMFAFLMKQAVEASVANKRLKSFLVADELNPLAVDNITDKFDTENAVEIKEAHLNWNARESSPILEIDHFTIPKKSLIAVVGKVGNGKSSLLSAILGEMEKVKGYVGVSGQLAYISQQPWIQNSSLRNNIIFGGKFDQKYYDKIIEACALVEDLRILPNGDATEIGEKGINLSGGQKARVALARAVYQNRNIYLLDDPLSAVDSHVGRHIFEKVIGHNGLLRNKTRILAMNNLAYLDEVDIVAYMQDGKLAACGPYEELLEKSEKFSKFIEACQTENGKEEDSKRESESNGSIVIDDDNSQLYEYEEAYDIEEVDEGSLVKFSRRISTLSTLDRRSSRIFHRSSLVKSFPENSNDQLSNDDKENKAKLIGIETIEVGRVKFGVYMQYIRSATFSTSLLFLFLIMFYGIFQMGLTKQFSLGVHLGIYVALGFAEGLCFFGSMLFLLISGLRASKNLHSPLFHRLLRSTMSFFDMTPVGRILNRLGKDIDVIDQALLMSFRFFVLCILSVVLILIVIVISTPIFVITIIPLALFYYFSLHFYIPTSRQMKRLESSTRSPIYQHFEKTIRGLVYIRAFEKVQEFSKSMEAYVDRFTRCKYSNILSVRWLAVRLEFIGNCIILCAALFAVLSQRWGNAISAGIAGLSVSYALSVTEVLNFAVRYISELELNIVAVERVKEYTETTVEAEWRVDQFKPVEDWPSKGQILLQNYSTRYHSKFDLVLRELNISINPTEKIGIVGRTGAGKSSLALALFRIIEPVNGTIRIDGIDISVIGLHDLRSNLTIIPQDPVIFSGTLRFNLDPFHTYSDREIWVALELAHLKTFVSSLAKGLEYRICEGGEDISVGQRQLICLTRALLRKSKVLVLDEATAAVDLATDSLIQETIRREFHDSTVLTIAHRLNTIIDYDRIIVLENGSVREFDSPQNLLANHSSVFYSMACDAQIIR